MSGTASLSAGQLAGIAGIGAAGSVGSSATSLFGARKRQRRTQVYTQRNMMKSYELTRKLRQTSAQDSVNDLKAAGLNPALMYGSGGASVQGGTVGAIPGGSASAGSLGDPVGAAFDAASNAQGIKRGTAQIKQANAQVKKAMADVKNVEANTKLTKQKQLTEAVTQLKVLLDRKSPAGIFTHDINASFMAKKYYKTVEKQLQQLIKEYK